jgi:hypothetical protein
MLYTILIVVLIVLLLGGLPHWPHMQGYSWGYVPSASVGVILVVLVVLILAGALR